MKILIGYDGSESSDEALDDLRRAGLPRESEVQVVSVADLLLQSGPPITDPTLQVFGSGRATAAAALERMHMHGEEVVKEAEAMASRAADRLRSEFPDWTVTDRVITGTPAWELIDAAENWGADLVVVGSQGRSAIGQLLIGSVSKKVATDSKCSVRVARTAAKKNADGASPPRIIVGVDGSLAAEEAIFAVGQRVWPAGTEVLLIAVDDTAPPGRIALRLPQAAAMIDSQRQNREERVRAMIEWATSELGAIGLETSIETATGDPKNVLLARADEWGADSIFVGTRDFKSAFERFRLGSVSTAVVTGARCSVEVVRASSEEERG